VSKRTGRAEWIRVLRGRILRVLGIDSRPTGLPLLLQALRDSPMDVDEGTLRHELEYLAEKGYLEVKAAPAAHDGGPNAFGAEQARITPHGRDCLEGSLATAEPGVRIEPLDQA